MIQFCFLNTKPDVSGLQTIRFSKARQQRHVWLLQYLFPLRLLYWRINVGTFMTGRAKFGQKSLETSNGPRICQQCGIPSGSAACEININNSLVLKDFFFFRTVHFEWGSPSLRGRRRTVSGASCWDRRSLVRK